MNAKLSLNFYFSDYNHLIVNPKVICRRIAILQECSQLQIF